MKILFTYLFPALIMGSCTQSTGNLKETEITKDSVETRPIPENVSADTAAAVTTANEPEKKDRPGTEPQTPKQAYLRQSDAVTDAKLNGEPILLQLDLSSKALSKYPDTLKTLLKGEYLGQEARFPRSVSDNFEKGRSTERITYPVLNYQVLLFENEFSPKPYKQMKLTVRKEKEKIIVE